MVVAINCHVTDESYYTILEDIDILKTIDVSVNHAGVLLNRGCLFFTLGLRFFFLTFPLAMYLFGPWLLIGTSICLVVALWAVDSTKGIKGRIRQPSDAIEMQGLTHSQTAGVSQSL
jgi:Protein of unknown function, DUF599